MIRPVATELALFLAPFVAYALFLWVRKEGVFDRGNWPMKRVMTLAIIAGVLMIGSFVVLSHFSGAPPGSTYEPAHIEDGKFVPGRVVR
jgi:hypothetical protein